MVVNLTNASKPASADLHITPQGVASSRYWPVSGQLSVERGVCSVADDPMHALTVATFGVGEASLDRIRVPVAAAGRDGEGSAASGHAADRHVPRRRRRARNGGRCGAIPCHRAACITTPTHLARFATHRRSRRPIRHQRVRTSYSKSREQALTDRSYQSCSPCTGPRRCLERTPNSRRPPDSRVPSRPHFSFSIIPAPGRTEMRATIWAHIPKASTICTTSCGVIQTYATDPLYWPIKGIPYQIAQSQAHVVSIVPCLFAEDNETGRYNDGDFIVESLEEIQCQMLRRAGLFFVQPVVGRVALAGFSAGTLLVANTIGHTLQHPFSTSVLKEVYMLDPNMNRDSILHERVSTANRFLTHGTVQETADKMARIYTQIDTPAARTMLNEFWRQAGEARVHPGTSRPECR